MEVLFKISAVALTGAVCVLLIKGKNAELAFCLSLACALSVCALGVLMLADIVASLRELINKTSLSNAVFSPLFKCVGIALITRIVNGFCKDAGQQGTATAVEYAGSIAALYTLLPLLKTLLKSLEGLL